jgi:hypothetical protein
MGKMQHTITGKSMKSKFHNGTSLTEHLEKIEGIGKIYEKVMYFITVLEIHVSVNGININM